MRKFKRDHVVKECNPEGRPINDRRNPEHAVVGHGRETYVDVGTLRAIREFCHAIEEYFLGILQLRQGWIDDRAKNYRGILQTFLPQLLNHRQAVVTDAPIAISRT